jgi:uncharacterized membrane protein (GlpM family)
MYQTIIKIAVSLSIILLCTWLARKAPSSAGLIAVMPLTGALVLFWTYIEHKGDKAVMDGFSRGAVWGILPTLLFFLVAMLCFRRNLALPVTALCSFSAWLAAASVLRLILK